MQATIAKQYLQINGESLLEITLQTLLDNQQIEKVVVSLAIDDEQWPELRCAKHAKIISAEGGATRARSVFNGLQALSSATHVKDDDWVLVHDAARPCLQQELLNKLIDELVGDPVGGLLAIQARDTLKFASVADQRIEQTLDRARIWQAQTPQMFRFGVLSRALQHALDAGLEITDEASAIELAGLQPKLIAGDGRNIKVTSPEDLKLAQLILSK